MLNFACQLLISQKISENSEDEHYCISMKQNAIKLSGYRYYLPESVIALAPASPRDSAKLMIYDKTERSVRFDTFRNINNYLPPKSILVINDTKVIPARLMAKKKTGGKAEIFFLRTRGKYIEALSNKRLAPKTRLYISPKFFFTVIGHTAKSYIFMPSFPTSRIFEILNRFGKTPLPPYLKHSPLSESGRRRRYQAIFAHINGSAAAPTASLHFTKPLINMLKRHGHSIIRVTLHVGLGTFAPLKKNHLRSGRLHGEFFEVSASAAAALNQAKRENRPVVAVGTTTLRALESAVNKHGVIRATASETTLFIRPGYRFRATNALITNFHVPESSLMMLVAALTGRQKLLKLYKLAIRKNFHFLSFGDAMLIK